MSKEKTEVSEEILEKAEKTGWVPKEEWKGNPDQWRPAEEFVERGEKIAPILKDRNRKLEEKFDNLESEMKTIIGTQKAEIERVKAESYDRAKTDYEAKLVRLDAKELEAFSEGDVDEFQKVTKEKINLKPPEKPVETQAPPKSTPVFNEWHKQNDWYIPTEKKPEGVKLEMAEDAELGAGEGIQGTVGGRVFLQIHDGREGRCGSRRACFWRTRPWWG